MLNQEEKEFRDFIDKFNRSIFELRNDFTNLSDNNKVRVKEHIIKSAGTQTQLEILLSISKHL